MTPMPPISVQQPNSANCFACGLRNPVGLKLVFYESGPAEVTAAFQPEPQYEGFPGVLHGGIIAALLDEAGGRAAMVGDHNHFMLTARLAVRYRLPTPLNQPLTVSGRLLTKRGSLATAHAELRLPDGAVTAEAEITLAEPPPGTVPTDNLEALGWKVYD
jgi:acyl-coenzyme A thioesterase PaaI-like protein